MNTTTVGTLAWLPLCGLLLGACAARAPLNPKAMQQVRDAVRLISRGELDRAEARLNLALEYNPSYAEALNGLGLVYYHRGQHARAATTFRRALQIDGELSEAHNNLGVIVLEARSYRDATRCFRAALAIDPGYANARYNLALALLGQGALREAGAELLKTLSVAPRMAAAQAELGCLYGYQGRRAAADRALRAALALDATLAPAHRCRGRLLREGGDLVGSETALRRARALDPSDEEALHELAITLLLAGKGAAAEGELRQLLRRQPRLPQAHFAYAYLLQSDLVDQARQARAERHLRLALHLRRDYPAALLLLGDLRARGGRDGEATEAYRGFLARVPLELFGERARILRWLQARQGRRALATPTARIAGNSR